MTRVTNAWFALVAPLRTLAEQPGTAPNDNMVMTRVVKRVLGVGRDQLQDK